jgi:gamma-glutamyltranspeptidase
LGEDGVVVNRFLLIAHSIKFASEFLLQQPGSCNLKDLLLTKTSTRKGGRESFLKEGDILKQPVLANAFKLVAKHGSKVLYEGPLAEANIRSSSNTLLGMIARIIEVIITLYLASPVQQPNFSFRYEYFPHPNVTVY